MPTRRVLSEFAQLVVGAGGEELLKPAPEGCVRIVELVPEGGVSVMTHALARGGIAFTSEGDDGTGGHVTVTWGKDDAQAASVAFEALKRAGYVVYLEQFGEGGTFTARQLTPPELTPPEPGSPVPAATQPGTYVAGPASTPG